MPTNDRRTESIIFASINMYNDLNRNLRVTLLWSEYLSGRLNRINVWYTINEFYIRLTLFCSNRKGNKTCVYVLFFYFLCIAFKMSEMLLFFIYYVHISRCTNFTEYPQQELCIRVSYYDERKNISIYLLVNVILLSSV